MVAVSACDAPESDRAPPPIPEARSEAVSEDEPASPAGTALKAALLGESPEDPRLRSEDPVDRLAFIDDLIRELEPLFTPDYSSLSVDQHELAEMIGTEAVESPFLSLPDKFWGAGLPLALEAVEPTLRRATWTDADRALARRFADYVALGPMDPLLDVTGTDRRHDIEEIEQYSARMRERFEDCQFRGGLVFTWTGGPYRPVMVEEPRLAQPTSQLEISPTLRLSTGLSSEEKPRSVIQAVDSLDAVVWTCALPGVAHFSFSGPPEREEGLGWILPLHAGEEDTSVYLDDTGWPCFYIVPFY